MYGSIVQHIQDINRKGKVRIEVKCEKFTFSRGIRDRE